MTKTQQLSPRERIGQLLEARAVAQQALAQVEEQRGRLLYELAEIDQTVRQLQAAIDAGTPVETHEGTLASQLQRIDQEIGATNAAHPAQAAPAALPGDAPQPWVERRKSPRPAPIRLADLNIWLDAATDGAETAGAAALLERARRALLGGRA